MKILRGNAASTQGIAATIGNFDGVHLGHQALLAEVVKNAKQTGLPATVILFEPQPAEYFAGAQAPARLSDLRDKVERFSACQIDQVLCLRFDKTMAAMPAKNFVETILFKQLQVKYLLVGQDFRFGYQRKGDVDLLRQLASLHNVSIQTCEDYTLVSDRISSTRVRQSLADSDFALAELLLGRPYTISGRVCYGAQRGRRWGIPTANIRIHQKQRALKGVFFVKVHRKSGAVLQGVANIGTRPTVDGSQSFLEVHILQFDGVLYGECIRVEFLEKHRAEIKFLSVEALIEQIRCDIQSCYDFFKITAPIEE
jgi:riboflavin kinase / FMN adenylyltransferase